MALVPARTSMCSCWDYKVAANRVANVESYPLPRIDGLLASLTGGKIFSKLDMSHAYLIKIQKHVTIATHKGHFRCSRMLLELYRLLPSSNEPWREHCRVFNMYMCTLYMYIDDLLVADTTETEHIVTLEKVISRLGE